MAARVAWLCHAIILFAHVDHPFAQRDSVDIGDLHGQPLLLREPGSTTRTTMEAALRAAGVQPRTDLEIGSREVIREAVARGLGLGAVSEAEFIADPASCPCASRASRPAPRPTCIAWQSAPTACSFGRF